MLHFARKHAIVDHNLINSERIKPMVTEVKSDNTQSCYLRLPSDMHKALRILCAVNKRSINIEVQEALLVHLRKHKEQIEAAGNVAIP